MDTRAPSSVASIKLFDPRLFSPDQTHQAKTLFLLVVAADYHKVVELIRSQPELMFVKINYTYGDGRSETLSPLQYAFKTYDSYMWKLLKSHLGNNELMLANFYQQEHDQVEHIDLVPLFQLYVYYGNQFNGWLKDQINFSTLSSIWMGLGMAQYNQLPAHMFRELCRADNGICWKGDASFDTDTIPRPVFGRIYHAQTGNTLHFSKVKNTKLPLYRISSHSDCIASSAPANYAWLQIDLACLQRLYEIRKAELGLHFRHNLVVARMGFRAG